jgi:hypothetical protein
MILRRLGDAIARQDWFVVLIELIVLVAGIFIGLQVDDWNQARKDRVAEQQFLVALHEDIILAERLSARVRERRLRSADVIVTVNDVLFDRAGRDILTDEECRALGSANFFNISITGLPAVEELIATGRLGIVQDAALRGSLIRLQQTHTALMTMIAIQSSQASFRHLPSAFPELIRTEAYFDTDVGEIRNHMTCDLEGMRHSQAFLNAWGANADGYDAYVRDGLRPWSDQFAAVHAMVDEALGLKHAPTDKLDQSKGTE